LLGLLGLLELLGFVGFIELLKLIRYVEESPSGKKLMGSWFLFNELTQVTQ
jgi:hypothetical protein